MTYLVATSQHHGHRDVLIRPLAWLGRVDVEGADGLAGQPHRDTGHAGHTNPDSGIGKIWPSSGLLAHVGDSNDFAGVVGISTRARLHLLLNALQLPGGMIHRCHVVPVSYTHL